MNREPMNGAEQNRSMKNGKQDKKNCERNPNSTSLFSLRFGIFFLIHLPRAFYPMDRSVKSKGERRERRPPTLETSKPHELDRINRIVQDCRRVCFSIQS